jgi:hypothetical protein
MLLGGKSFDKYDKPEQLKAISQLPVVILYAKSEQLKAISQLPVVILYAMFAM